MAVYNVVCMLSQRQLRLWGGSGFWLKNNCNFVKVLLRDLPPRFYTV